MKTLRELYQTAKTEHIPVDYFRLHNRQALSIMDEDGNCYIAIDPLRLTGENDERLKLAHELGHCIKGAFYNRYSKFDCRRRHENTADKWAIRQLITADELDTAIAEGCTELWDLADRFGVTEDFMKKTVCYYVYGNVATELYF